MQPKHIVIAGAGSIGCYVGGHLAANGHKVTLLGRARILDPIRETGLTLSDFTGAHLTVPAAVLRFSETPDCLRDADIILVTVKSGATASIAQDIAAHASVSAPILSLQNGVDNAELLRANLPNRDIRAGMVPFNVVPRNGGYHRSTSGDILIQSGTPDLSDWLSGPTLPMVGTDDITAIQWGKLVINLANALNALSGLTLRDMLMDRSWRHLFADQIDEALTVFTAARITAKGTTPLPLRYVPKVLRLPTWAFRRIAAPMLTIDPTARTSMAYDVMAGRPTEIDVLQGRIIALGAQVGVATPLSAHIAQAIQTATATQNKTPNLTASDLKP